MYTFCTYFDSHYLPRGLALYESLKKYRPNFTLWVLCLDSICHSYLASLKQDDLKLVSLDELEQEFPRLLEVKQSRTLIEYYFTCTPLIPQYVVSKTPGLDMITYLDADMYFFANPAPIFDEMEHYSIGIIEHRYPTRLRAEMDPYGIYNVGWVTFRCDDEGLACLRLWCEQCLDWCYDRLEGDRYADQKYLEEWPRRFRRVRVIQHKGANVAPWNFTNYRFHHSRQGVCVDEQPLIFFHFHGFKQKTTWLYDTHAARYNAKPSKTMRKAVIEPYINALSAQQGYTQIVSRGIRAQALAKKVDGPIGAFKRMLGLLSMIANGQQVIFVRKRVLF